MNGSGYGSLAVVIDCRKVRSLITAITAWVGQTRPTALRMTSHFWVEDRHRITGIFQRFVFASKKFYLKLVRYLTLVAVPSMTGVQVAPSADISNLKA